MKRRYHGPVWPFVACAISVVHTSYLLLLAWASTGEFDLWPILLLGGGPALLAALSARHYGRHGGPIRGASSLAFLVVFGASAFLLVFQHYEIWGWGGSRSAGIPRAVKAQRPPKQKRPKPAAPAMPDYRRLCLETAKNHWQVDRRDYTLTKGLGWETYTGPNPHFFDFTRLRYISAYSDHYSEHMEGQSVVVRGGVHAPVRQPTSERWPWEAPIECVFRDDRSVRFRTIERTNHAPIGTRLAFEFLDRGSLGQRVAPDGSVWSSTGPAHRRVVTATYRLPAGASRPP